MEKPFEINSLSDFEAPEMKPGRQNRRRTLLFVAKARQR
jgi:hypothetical protein